MEYFSLHHIGERWGCGVVGGTGHRGGLDVLHFV